MSVARVFVSGVTEKDFVGQYIFLDNDFVSLLFRDAEALDTVVTMCQKGALMIDSLTRFEFLCYVYLSKQWDLKKKFIDDSKFFTPAVEHQMVFEQIRTNALALSYLYAHKGRTSASPIDLFLASRVMLSANNSFIITGNRKDFPNFIFDTVGVVNYEDGQDCQTRAYSILRFNPRNYEIAVKELSKVQG